METHDHAMFAGVNASLYTQLAGIAPASPGYRDVRIDPQVPPGLAHVSASQDTVRGTVAAEWWQTDTFRLDVRVPANVVATVHVPHPAGQLVLAPAGAQRVGEDLYRVAGGDWSFSTAKTSVDVPGTVGGTVPPTLSLTLGAPASFGAFTPGVDRDYTASTTATVTSSAGRRAPRRRRRRASPTARSRCRHRSQVALSKSEWTAPVSNESVAVGFTQHIGATDPLRTGVYSRTLTFSLSTTSP